MINSKDHHFAGKVKSDDIESYSKDGYLIIRNLFADSIYLKRIMEDITQLGKIFDHHFEMPAAASHILAMSKTNRTSFYRGLRYLPSLATLASSDVLTGLSWQLGLAMPAVMHSNNIRMDMPNEVQHLFHWHQDILYLLGSLNSVTYWLPLGKVDAHHGGIALIPGSHRQGISPVRYTPGGEPSPTKVMSPKDLALVNEPTTGGDAIEVHLGDLVVFSQLILHKSTPNYSDKVRWTVQIRHSDFADPQFVAAGFPFGDHTNLFHNGYLVERNKP